MQGWTVRAATVADWALVRDVRLRALAEAPEAFGSTLARESEIGEAGWRDRVAPGSWVVAVDGDRVLGVAAGVAEPGRPADERHLVGMWVDPAWRGRSVGDDLVAAVQRWAEARGCRRLSLWVADGNVRARRFYLRLGFRATGERQPLPSNPAVGEERLVRP